MKPTRLALLALAACALAGPRLQAEETKTIDPVEIWTKNCKKCHAEDGSGDTKMGQKFGARDYTDPKVQASFTDKDIVEITKAGVVDEKGKKLMPPYDKKLTDEEIQSLVPLIREFAEKKE